MAAAGASFQVRLSGVNRTERKWKKCNNEVTLKDPSHAQLTWKVQMVWNKYLVDTSNPSTDCHEHPSANFEQHKTYMPKLYVTLYKAEDWEIQGQIRVSILEVNDTPVNSIPTAEVDVDLEAADENGHEVKIKEGFLAYPSDTVLVKIEHLAQPALTFHA
jgi:hypothetical protein